MQLAHMIWMQVFLHSKFHQIWVYLHFPLHLCQIAFGIELVNMLKLYRAELIDDGYLSSSTENGTTKASSEGGKLILKHIILLDALLKQSLQSTSHMLAAILSLWMTYSHAKGNRCH